MRAFAGLIVVGMLCGCATQSALTVSDAHSAAAIVAREVTFTDEVMAVSFKRTRPEGVFLSFGAPYPQQVLSVWFPMDVWKQRPEPQRALLHRRVTVRGRPHDPAQGTAPIIDIEENSQLTFTAVDERVLESTVLRSMTDRDAVVFALKQKAEREGIELVDALERIRGVLLETGHIAWLYSALSLSVDEADQRYASRAAQLEAWAQRFPSLESTVALARLDLDQAWHARGSGYADTVSASQWADFNRFTTRAAERLDARADWRGSNQAWRCRLAIALNQSWDDERYWDLFRDATKAFPDELQLYTAALNRLLPKWRGQPGEWESFLEAERVRRGADGDAFYARMSWTMHQQFRHRLLKDTALQWNTMARGFEQLIAGAERKHDATELRLWRSVYAHFAFEANDLPRLRAALDAMGDDADMSVWANLQNVMNARKKAMQR